MTIRYNKTNCSNIYNTAVSFGCTKKEYYIVEHNNPEYRKNTAFKYTEDLSSTKFEHLIKKYQLDTVFQDEKDEFKRMLLLRDWIKTLIKIDDIGPYRGEGYVEGILDAAMDGDGFQCGDFMKVQKGIMKAYGYVGRTIGASPGVKDVVEAHHGDIGKTHLSDLPRGQHIEYDI